MYVSCKFANMAEQVALCEKEAPKKIGQLQGRALGRKDTCHFVYALYQTSIVTKVSRSLHSCIGCNGFFSLNNALIIREKISRVATELLLHALAIPSPVFMMTPE